MLPPVDQAVLEINPKFEALYTDLCAQKLHTDGSSKLLDAKAIKEREGFVEELHKQRKEAAKKKLVQDGLHRITVRDENIPEELRELVIIIAASMGGDVAEDDLEVVEDEVERFLLEENTKPVAAAFSKQIQQEAGALIQVLSSGDEDLPSISDLPRLLRTVESGTNRSRSKLADTRLDLADTMTDLHVQYRQVLETCIRLLEQTIHGSLSRATKAKADYISTVAEGMAKKLGIQHIQLMQQVHSADLQGVIQEHLTEVEEEKVALKIKVKDSEYALMKYSEVRGMEDLTREYAEVLQETEKVRAELTMLESGWKGA